MYLHFRRIKSLLIFSGMLLFSFPLFSQRLIEVKYEQDPKGGYVFSCVNNSFCNYILELGFTTFNNLKCDQPLPFHAEVKPGYNKLFTISAINPQSPVQFKYGSQYQKGCMHPSVNKDFIYLLPISPGKRAQVYEMSPDKLKDSASQAAVPTNKSPDKLADSLSWYVLRLKMKPGDTIYSARKGIVNELRDQNGANDAGQTSIGTENFIEIVHADCSFARYGILKKNSAFVKPGQLVKAGQPIGLVGGDAYGRGSDLRFSVYYYQEENGSLNQTSIPHYIITPVWTKNNGTSRLKHGAVYISEFPAAVLNQEVPVKKVKSKK
jgi:Peptidase family M23